MSPELFLICLWLHGAEGPPAPAPGLRDEAARALRRAGEFFRKEVSAEGGYLWRYSEDLVHREGEGAAGARTVWVQPPGTPAVGLAFLEAHGATADPFFLDAARDAARCLVRGQLRSGGWTYRIELDPAERGRHAYRVEPEGRKRANVSTLDDETTQSALRLLIRVDRALEGKDPEIREAALYGLEALLAAQHSIGAFPQGFQGPAAPRPSKRASLPEAWPRERPASHRYWELYTLNDGVLEDVIDVLLEASKAYGDGRFRAAALKVGEFLLLAQMPEPQPGWAQQYDFDMQPAWARKFEPPAITGGEGQGAMAALLRLHRETGDPRYLEPIPRALAYYRRSLLPDGRLARFYELGTNRPLYFTRDYRLTHDDGDLPTHYAFKVASKLERIERERGRLAAMKPEDVAWDAPEAPRASAALEGEARKAAAALDSRGRWVEEGGLKTATEVRRVISSETFIRNMEVLSRYLSATAPSR